MKYWCDTLRSLNLFMTINIIWQGASKFFNANEYVV